MSLLGVPDDALHAARWLAWQAAASGRLALAGQILDGLAVLDARDLDTAKLRAEVALRAGRLAVALDASHRALQLAPRDPGALALHGRALLGRGERAEARRWLVAAAAAGEPLAARLVEGR